MSKQVVDEVSLGIDWNDEGWYFDRSIFGGIFGIVFGLIIIVNRIKVLNSCLFYPLNAHSFLPFLYPFSLSYRFFSVF